MLCGKVTYGMFNLLSNYLWIYSFVPAVIKLLFWAVHLEFFNDVFKTIFTAFTFALKYTVYTYKSFSSYTVSMIPSHIHILRSGSLAHSLEAT